MFTNPNQIQVKIKLFAIFQEVFATDEIHLEIESGTTVSQIFDH
ncbi:MAG: MoaD/ThiS family protein [Pseudanabaena sp.]